MPIRVRLCGCSPVTVLRPYTVQGELSRAPIMQCCRFDSEGRGRMPRCILNLSWHRFYTKMPAFSSRKGAIVPPLLLFLPGLLHGISPSSCRLRCARVFYGCGIGRFHAPHQTPIRIKAVEVSRGPGGALRPQHLLPCRHERE